MSLSDLQLLLPELVLFLAGMVVLVADFLASKESRKTWLPWLALAGLAATLIAVIALWGSDETFLSGMMRLDGFALFFKLFVVLAAALVVLMTPDFLRERTAYRGEFYALLLFASLAIMLLSGAADLITVYLSMEFLSITSYVLVGYLREDKKSAEGAIKYFLYGAGASAVMLYGMSLLYGAAGTTSLAGIASRWAGGRVALQEIMLPAVVLLLTGFGFKCAFVPFHQWVPDAYEGAPTPVTAYLSVASKGAGFAVLLRVFLTALPYVQGDWAAILAALSMVSMTLGNLVALKQTNIKRMLAYSSIAQAGYIVIGLVSIGTDPASPFNGLSGVVVYLFAYLFTNLGAFAAVIAVENATGSTEIESYAGLSQRSLPLALLLAVSLLSLAGTPATGGFVGKLFVFGAAIKQQFYVLALVAIVNSVVAAFYYLNVVRYMFFEPLPEGKGAVSVSGAVVAALTVAAVGVFVVGLYWQPFLDLASRSVQVLAMR